MQPVVNRIDPRSNDEHWTCLALGKEVAQGPVKRTRHLHRFACAGNQRKRARYAAHCLRGSVQYNLSRLFDREAIDLVCFRLREINHALNILLLHRVLAVTSGSE